MFELDLDKVAAYVETAETEDLMDRVTVYRADMEPAAVELMVAELVRRGVTPEDVAAHERARRESAILSEDGTALRCSFCDRPAVWQGWDWHRLWGYVPVFPRVLARCEKHLPG